MSRVLVACLGLMSTLAGAAEPRARDLGIPFEGTPGPLNAITDVAGVTVGQVTLIKDLTDGRKVRTGVTAILPLGQTTVEQPVFAGWSALNGAGEMTGTTWLRESGQLEGPVLLTNSHSVGMVHHAVIAWRVRAGAADASGYWWSTPVVAETWDGTLNDINGFHVKPEHVDRALVSARSGPVEEGNVGAGTGVVCHGFKCGIGTSSRRVAAGDALYTLGVLVQANYGEREDLLIAGVPVGRHLRNDRVDLESADEAGSIIIVVATDAPLLPHQLERISRRAGMGLARMGSHAHNGSGDIFVAFSTANGGALDGRPLSQAAFLANDLLNPLFLATVQATEEAITNALIAARDMQGTEGSFARAIDHEALIAVLKRYGRIAERR
jgi:D-aminopeptidase